PSRFAPLYRNLTRGAPPLCRVPLTNAIEEKDSVVVVRQRRSSAPAVPAYTEADVVALSERNNEPTWLRESRLAAWDYYRDLPMPSQQDEDWRRTDYRSIRWDEASPLVKPTGAGLDIVPSANMAPLAGDEQGGF